MADITTAIQRRRAQIEKLQHELDVLSAAQDLLMSGDNEETTKRPSAPAVVNGAERNDRVVNRFP